LFLLLTKYGAMKTYPLLN